MISDTWLMSMKRHLPRTETFCISFDINFQTKMQSSEVFWENLQKPNDLIMNVKMNLQPSNSAPNQKKTMNILNNEEEWMIFNKIITTLIILNNKNRAKINFVFNLGRGKGNITIVKGNVETLERGEKKTEQLLG